ncbi:hypothetical protein [Candidatus Nitrososphaera gargensis]|uniref:hypothetical protein n=1 Tax=Candidatus Nitrososphaera gargensis TaxID=497727 RepID=UPI0011E53BA0|nr:hypothetical protein [Candidatus Nitrososphaera gargensis]
MSEVSLSTKQAKKRPNAKRCKVCGHEMKRLYVQIGYVRRGIGWICWREIAKASRYKTLKKLDYQRIIRIDEHVHLVGSGR